MYLALSANTCSVSEFRREFAGMSCGDSAWFAFVRETSVRISDGVCRTGQDMRRSFCTCRGNQVRIGWPRQRVLQGKHQKPWGNRPARRVASIAQSEIPSGTKARASTFPYPHRSGTAPRFSVLSDQHGMISRTPGPASSGHQPRKSLPATETPNSLWSYRAADSPFAPPALWLSRAPPPRPTRARAGA